MFMSARRQRLVGADRLYLYQTVFIFNNTAACRIGALMWIITNRLVIIHIFPAPGRIAQRVPMMPLSWFSLPLLALLSAAVLADEVDRSFNPYAAGLPSFPGLAPGVLINKGNVDAFQEALDPGLYLALKRGWYEMRVGATTPVPAHKLVLEATRKNLNKTRLGTAPGDIEGYVAGRPFVEEPALSDPRAGDKLAWDYKYSLGVAEAGVVYPFYWRYRDMKSGQVERQLKFSFHILKYRHRLTDPAPELANNPSAILYSIYAKVLEPADLKNTQLLIQRFDDDHKIDDAYMSLGVQRRVRRLATGQTTDAFLGSDVMIEDFEGYNGNVSDMKWTYKGTRNVLLPYFDHSALKLASDLPEEADGYRFVNFTGSGGCFPEVPWQLRKVYVLEAEPLRANHPISKRIFYLDAQTMTISLGLIYDRRGELWKIGGVGKALPDTHLAENHGIGAPVDDAFFAVDVQAMHCTTGQFKTRMSPQASPPALFQVQNMRGGD